MTRFHRATIRIGGVAEYGASRYVGEMSMRAAPALSWTTAFAPATVANLGPGFDILGLALDDALGLGDTCEVALQPAGQWSLEVTGDGGRLPTDPAQNAAAVVARAVLERAGVQAGLAMRLHKGLPLGSGLGSSAASAASAALAANAAIGAPFTRRELVAQGRVGEALCAGSPHPDNVAPALLGGILLMAPDPDALPDGLQIVRLPVPERLRVAVVIPELEVRTADARAALPKHVPVADAVTTAAHVGLMVSALYEGDLARLGLGTRDVLHQPYRAPLVRGFVAARAAALASGALGVGLSGSGPAMFALADGDSAAHRAGEALVRSFAESGVVATWRAGRIAPPQP